MKKAILLIMALSSMTLISACVTGKPGNGPDHCPPGHHMKGWC